MLFCVLFAGQPSWAAPSGQAQFLKGVELLTASNFEDKEEGVRQIGTSKDPKAAITLESLLAGRLFLVKKDKAMVIGEPGDVTWEITELLTGKKREPVKKAELKKISINNSLRGLIKEYQARLSLDDENPQVRLQAIRSMIGSPDPGARKLLQERLSSEQEQSVREAIELVLATAELSAPEPERRLKAIEGVRGNLNPEIKNELLKLIQREKDNSVKRTAEKVLHAIEEKIAWFARLETLFFGLSMGSVLVLAAIGLAITFGVIGVINMAHGELIMLGAYTTYVIQQWMPQATGWALALSVPAAFCVSGLVGIAIERSVIRFLYGRPLETLLATFGLSLVLQQTVRTIFSPLNRSVSTPAWMSGSIVINPVLSLTINRVTIFIFAMLIFAALYMLLKKSPLGLQVRAIAQNRSMARAMGIKASRVDALTFGLGSGIAGIAGVALSQLTNVGPNLGQAYIIDSFMVVVFGGVGNLFGTLLGGLSLGIVNKFLEPWSGAVLAKIIVLVFIILFIQKRPQGLFPQKGRAAE